MTRSPILIEYAPDRLVVARQVRAGGARRKRIDLDPAEFDRAWAEGLAPLVEPLAQAVAALDATGAPAYILARTPGATVDAIAVPAAGRAAELAARLALIDGASLDPLLDPIDVCVLGVDASTDAPQSHMLACGIRAAEARSLCALAESAGVRPVTIMPPDAPAMALAVADALAPRGACEARLHVEEHATVLAAGADGRLVFVRTIDVGIEAVIESLSRAFPAPTRAQSCALARAALERFGVPRHADVIDESRALRGDDLLPLIQPVLQRLIVETKQSFRFALNDSHRAELRVILTGAGAAIERLDDFIAEQLERHVERDAKARPLASLAPADLPPICLLPQERMTRRLTQRVGRALAAGVFTACALLAGEALLAHVQAGALQNELKALRPSLRSAERTEEDRARDRQVAAALLAVERRIEKHAGAPTQWAPVLADLLSTAPEQLSLASIDGALRAGAVTLTLRGQSTAPGDRAAHDVRDFAAALDASPLTSVVTLGATERISTELGAARRFEITVTLVPLPREASQETAP